MADRTGENIEDVYELSPMQEGMLFHTLREEGTGVYVEQLVCTIRGALDTARLTRAWQLVVGRHPVLRTAFVWEGLERPMQAVRRQVDIPIEEHDWRGVAEVSRSERLEALIEDDRRRSFHLERAPLMRVTLVRMADERTVLLWTHHHLLLDGWSIPLVLREVGAAYDDTGDGHSVGVSRPRPYRDYIAWLRSRDTTAAKEAWARELAGVREPTPLPLARAAAGDARDARVIAAETRLSDSTTRALEQFARTHGLTLNTVVLGAFALVLAAHGTSDDVVFGATVSGRPADLDGAERMLGLFVNSLPVRIVCTPEQRVSAWLRGIQRRQATLREHDATPLSSIGQWIDLPPQVPLFETVLVFVNYPVDAALAGDGGALVLEEVRGLERSSMPLTVFAVPGTELAIRAQGDTSRYSHETLQAVARQVRAAVEALIADASRPLGRVSLLDPEQTEQRLVHWNAPMAPVPALTAHALFEEQAKMRPDAIAVIHECGSLTYAELNARANQLAHYLLALGVRADEPVALSVDRSFDMIVGALALMKAGAAYVPIDPGFPAPRLAAMIETARVRRVLTDRADAASPDVQVIRLNEHLAAIGRLPQTNPVITVDPGQVAYVIFTSGSTGEPKGAALTHRALGNLLLHMRQHQPGVGPGDRMVAVATMSFDLAVLELTLPLSNGAAIVIADRTTAADGRALQGLLRDHDVTVMQGTPSLWRLLLASGWDGMPRVTMMTGGEPLPTALAAQLLARGRSLWNLYGPTETTIYSAGRRVESLSSTTSAIELIGAPMPNQPHYILDRQLRPVAPGATGEIFIGGHGVARGYINRPDLTAERFLPDPFSGEPGARMYRSGDLARYGSAGSIEFAGRADFQVKIRGYRVEPGEVAAAIEPLPGVRECIVMARNDGDSPRLVAYVAATADTFFDEPAARAALRARLPEYMVPSAFVVLDDFPRLPNGKPDRRKLPEPGAARPDLAVAYQAPAGPFETNIARLWQDVLKLDRVGVHDNFFDVGGHSLLAVTLLGKLREMFGREIPLVDLFAYPTVRQMADFLGTPAVSAAAVGGVGAGPGALPGQDRLRAQRARRAGSDD